jgi:hypothetical protein
MPACNRQKLRETLATTAASRRRISPIRKCAKTIVARARARALKVPITMAKREMAGTCRSIANGRSSGDAEAIRRIAQIALSSAAPREAEYNFFIWLGSRELVDLIEGTAQRNSDAEF